MRRIEIGVINPRDEQQALREWAARVDAGEIMPNAESRLSFATYSLLHSALTNKRMELLECVAQHEGMNIRKLAGQIGRDYKNVYDDVQLLIQLGLIEKQGKALFAPYDDINIHKSLRKAA